MTTNPICAVWGHAANDLKASINMMINKPEQARDMPVQISEGVGFIRVKGVMFKGMGDWGGMIADTARARRQVVEAVNSSTIDQIVLVLDSPGGSVDGLAELGDAVRDAAAVKPVTAQVDGMAASAAYYVASQATSINLGRQDLVGSIGTRMQLFDTSKMFEDMGIRSVMLDTGEHKSTGAMGEPITDEQEAELQRMVDVFFDDFKQVVMRGRNMSASQLEPLADGRVFIGQEAVSLGLADRVSPFAETIGAIRRGQEAKRLRAKAVKLTT